jgi:hypothetical protein
LTAVERSVRLCKEEPDSQEYIEVGEANPDTEATGNSRSMTFTIKASIRRDEKNE